VRWPISTMATAPELEDTPEAASGADIVFQGFSAVQSLGLGFRDATYLGRAGVNRYFREQKKIMVAAAGPRLTRPVISRPRPCRLPRRWSGNDPGCPSSRTRASSLPS
jgi:hypothetical protein